MSQPLLLLAFFISDRFVVSDSR